MYISCNVCDKFARARINFDNNFKRGKRGVHLIDCLLCQLINILLQIASPSIDSFSTLPDQEISDFQTDSRDLQVKVDNPQKHLETLETYITFRITTRVSIIIIKYDLSHITITIHVTIIYIDYASRV